MTTWNPTIKGTNIILQDNNLTVTNFSQTDAVKTIDSNSNGKYFAEFTINSGSFWALGVSNSTVNVSGTPLSFNSIDSYSLLSSGQIRNGNTLKTYTTRINNGDIIGLLIDKDNNNLTFYKNGVSLGYAYSNINNLNETVIFISGTSSSIEGSITANFGDYQFKFPNSFSTLPNGVKSWDKNQTITDDNRNLIFNNGVYKTFKQKKYSTSIENAIPILTSFNTPSGYALASSNQDSTYTAWKAFDGNDTSEVSSWHSVGSIDEWLSYEFEVYKKIGKYSIYPYANNSTRSFDPKSWVFQGFLDGDWISLHSVSNFAFTFDKAEYFTVDKILENCKKYRLVFTQSNGGYKYAVSGFEMYEATVNNYSSWFDIGSTIPNSSTFLQYGIEDISVLNREKTDLPPITLEQDISWNGNGKLYKKSLNLKELINLKHIKSEVK